jgi:glycosyltransferase involved in cell wall biosynthesis
MTGPRPLRVAVDARLRSGQAGGIETVVIGLASGLAGLADGDEEYVFLAFEGATDWLEPHLGGNARIVRVSPSNAGVSGRRARVAYRWPALRRAWRKLPLSRLLPEPGPPRSDGTIERMGADVVHLPLQAGFMTTVPSIYHPHDLQHFHLPEYFTPRERQHRERWYGRLCLQAEAVVVTSSWGRDDLVRHFGLPTSKVRVIPWAPVLDAYPTPSDQDVADAQARWRLDRPFLLYPAQTWPHKNHATLLAAMARLRDERGLIVGAVFPGRRNDYAHVLDRLVKDLGLNDQVIWPGFVTGLQLASLYRLARAVVIPTYFEAASFPLWEAFMAGVPAACSDVTSLPEQAGDAALVFDPRDQLAMATAIERLWTEAELRTKLAARGRQRVAAFTWERTAMTFRALYRQVAGRGLSDADRALLASEPGI